MKGAISSPGDAALRGSGVLIIAVGLWAYDNSLPAAVAGLILPTLFAVGVLLVLRNLVAVSLGAGLLALVRTDLGGDWISGIAYPLIATLALGFCAAILLRRFRRRMRDTHAARWRSRRG